MTQSFKEYLMQYHAENYPTLDDLLPEAFADWITEVDIDVETILELAERWKDNEVEKVRKEEREKLDIMAIEFDKSMDRVKLDSNDNSLVTSTANSCYEYAKNILHILKGGGIR